MISTDVLFDGLCAWHRSRVPFATLGFNESAVSLLAACNVFPTAWTTRRNANDLSLVSSCCTVSVSCSSCKQQSTLFEDELEALRRLGPQSCGLLTAMSSSVEDNATQMPRRALSATSKQDNAKINELLARAHREGCVFRGLLPLMLLLHPNSLSPVNSLAVWARCAARQLGLHPSSSAATPSNPAAKPPKQRMLMPFGTPPRRLLNDIERTYRYLGAAHHLLYAGSNISEHILSVIFPPLATKRGRAEGKCDDEGRQSLEVRTRWHLCVLFQLYGYTLEEGDGECIEMLEAEAEDLTVSWTSSGPSAASKIQARCGFALRCRYCAGVPHTTIHSVMSQPAATAAAIATTTVGELNVVVDGSMAEVQERVLPSVARGDEATEEPLGALLPQVTSVAPQQHDENAAPGFQERPVSQGAFTEETENISGIPERQTTTFSYTFSAQAAMSGHCACCVWKRLFVDPVLGSSGAPQRPMTFSFSLTDGITADAEDLGEEAGNLLGRVPDAALSEEAGFERGGLASSNALSSVEQINRQHDTLTLVFDLSEVERMISCWRVSEEVDTRFRAAYETHPLDAFPFEKSAWWTTTSNDPTTAQEMERFLQTLATKDAASEASCVTTPPSPVSCFYDPCLECLVHGAPAVEEVVRLAEKVLTPRVPKLSSHTTFSAAWGTLLVEAKSLLHPPIEGRTADCPAILKSICDTLALQSQSVREMLSHHDRMDTLVSTALSLLYADVLPGVTRHDGMGYVVTPPAHTSGMALAEEEKRNVDSYVVQLKEAVARYKIRSVQPPPARAAVKKLAQPPPPPTRPPLQQQSHSSAAARHPAPTAFQAHQPHLLPVPERVGYRASGPLPLVLKGNAAILESPPMLKQSSFQHERPSGGVLADPALLLGSGLMRPVPLVGQALGGQKPVFGTPPSAGSATSSILGSSTASGGGFGNSCGSGGILDGGMPPPPQQPLQQRRRRGGGRGRGGRGRGVRGRGVRGRG